MIDRIKTVKIKSSHPSQGDFVEINEEDFDASKHVKYSDEATAAEQQEAPRRGRPPKSVVVESSGDTDATQDNDVI